VFLELAEGRLGVRLLLVDDHRAFSGAMALLLDAEPDLTVVATADRGRDALLALETHEPDVVVMDVEVGEDNGLELTRRILAAQPSAKVVILTCHDDIETATEAVRVGASAFVVKDAPAEELVTAIRATARGETVIPPTLLTGVLKALLHGDAAVKGPASRLALLTGREAEVLRMMVEGVDRTTIASRLYMSPNTVRTHTQKVLSKLGVHSSLEAVALAIRAGWAEDTLGGEGAYG
jgi:DNA-binding NarL/FixJ family response regulator